MHKEEEEEGGGGGEGGGGEGEGAISFYLLATTPLSLIRQQHIRQENSDEVQYSSAICAICFCSFAFVFCVGNKLKK